jgi:hypothetical protein
MVSGTTTAATGSAMTGRRRRLLVVGVLAAVSVTGIGLIAIRIAFGLAAQPIAEDDQRGTPPISTADRPVRPGTPRIWISDPMSPTFVLDGGSIPPNATSGWTLTISNEGTENLEIAGTWTSCGCMSAMSTRSWLSPGETAELLVGYDPALSNQDGLTFRTKRVIVSSSDPLVPQMEFQIEASFDWLTVVHGWVWQLTRRLSPWPSWP